MALDQVEGAGDAAQHAKAQHIDLHQAERIDILLVPFQHRAVGHGGIVQRHDLVEPALHHHETAGMLREMARKPHQLAGIMQRHRDIGRVGIEAEFGTDTVIGEIIGRPAPQRLRQGRDDIAGQAEYLADLANGTARPVAIDRCRHGGAAATVFLIDILDHLLAPLMLEIDIDIGRLAAFRRDKALEQQVDQGRVDLGNADGETDG